MDSLGDVLLSLPALQALRLAFPQADIDLLTARESSPLFEDLPDLVRPIAVKDSWFKPGVSFSQSWELARELRALLKKKSYDVAIDFRGDLRNILLMTAAGIPQRFGYGGTGGSFLLTQARPLENEKHQAIANLELIAPLVGETAALPPVPWVHAAEKKRKWYEILGIDLEKEKRVKIAIHAGAGYPSKRWPLENFKALTERLRDSEDVLVLLIGTEEEKLFFSVSGANVLDWRGKIPLERLPAVLADCDLLVGNDSAPAHLAALLGLEVISIFSGTNDFRLWRPWGKTEVIRHGVPCSPCEERECPLRHHDCMRKITVDEVWRHLEQGMRLLA